MTLSATSGDRLPRRTTASATNRIALFLNANLLCWYDGLYLARPQPSECLPRAQASFPAGTKKEPARWSGLLFLGRARPLALMGRFTDQKLRAGSAIAGFDAAVAVLLAGDRIGVAGRRLALVAELRLKSGSRLPARPEVRAAGNEGVGLQVALGVDHHGADRLGGRAGRGAPGQRGGGESELPDELEVARALARLDGDEGDLRVARERRREMAAARLGLVDAHRRHPLVTGEGDVGVISAASGLDGGNADQRQRLELDTRLGDALLVEGGVVEALDDGVGAVERAGSVGLDRQAPEGHFAGEGCRAAAEEAGRDGVLGEAVERLAVGGGGESVDPVPDDVVGNQRRQTAQKNDCECYQQDCSVPQRKPPLLVRRFVPGAASNIRVPAARSSELSRRDEKGARSLERAPAQWGPREALGPQGALSGSETPGSTSHCRRRRRPCSGFCRCHRRGSSPARR